MSKFLNPFYQQLTPYEPGEQLNDKRYIKLNTNESPFPPSPRVTEVLNGDLINRLNLYPDPTLADLKSSIAAYYGVGRENVFVANGSDDVIAFSIMAFCGRGGSLACPDITYGFYPVYAQLFGVELTELPLNADFRVRVQDYLHLNKNSIIANPNAPTGIALAQQEVEEIVRSNPENLVMLDEAYMDFCGQSVVPLTKRYDNLLVIQTFSKSRSLAGLRVGFAIGNEALIKDLENMRYSFNPYNMNALTLQAASAAISDRAYYDACISKIVAEREVTAAVLKAMGFRVLDSRANFVFAAHPKIPAETLYRRLREEGVLVRYFNKERIKNFVRITIGTAQQMKTVIEKIEEIIKE